MNELGKSQATRYITLLNWRVTASRIGRIGLLNERIAEEQEELLSASLLWQVDDSSLFASAQLSIWMDGFSIRSMELGGRCVMLWWSLGRVNRDTGPAVPLFIQISINFYTILWTLFPKIVYMFAHKMYSAFNMHSMQWLSREIYCWICPAFSGWCPSTHFVFFPTVLINCFLCSEWESISDSKNVFIRQIGVISCFWIRWDKMLCGSPALWITNKKIVVF